jgi:prephenate dehydratase/chorismate mutase
MELHSARNRIDLIDGEIVALLRERMELALRVGRLKESVCEPERERAVLENVGDRASGALDRAFVVGLYRAIISESTRLQKAGYRLAGFQGEHGAYSEAAALAFNRQAVAIPCRDFAEVFAEVEAGRLDCAVVPVENSLEGAVTEVNDLLAETSLKITAEITLPVRHRLLALPGVDLKALEVVYSHPQALAQCRNFLARRNLEARPFYDTAGAAKMVSHKGHRSAGVLASAQSASLYNLAIVEEHAGDRDSNATRFLVLSKTAPSLPGEKCSIVFTVAHEAGTLSRVLRVFSDSGINLTRIESRPLKDIPGHYRFFLDFEGSDRDERIIRVLDEAEKIAGIMKFLGCYKEIRL